MNHPDNFISSGILEMYVLGDVSPEESLQVEQMAASYPEIAAHLQEISEALERYARIHAMEPQPTSRAFVMATIDYGERMSAGEKPVFPPTLNEYSTLAGFAEYISRDDKDADPHFTGIEARIIGYTPSLTTAIVWLKDTEISEVHTHEIEKFLIIEGTCMISMRDEIHEMAAGDYMSIPINTEHFVKVTSEVPCKVLVQRIAV